MTPEQCRMARAALGWSSHDLAEAAGVGISTVNRFETDQATPIEATLAAMKRALENAGAIFLDDSNADHGGVGVRLGRPRASTTPNAKGASMHIVSVINYKGGVGKTSITANVGAELAWRGKRVLLIDLDAQASLTFSFITPEEWVNDFEKQMTIKSWFDAFERGKPIKLSSLIHTPQRMKSRLDGRGSMDIICSHLGLINVDLDLAVKLGGASLAQAKLNFINIHRRLAAGLQEKAFQDYDIVLIDCPPNFNIVTKTAIVASNYILVPTRPDQLSTLGIDYLMRNVEKLTKDYNDYAEIDTGDVAEKIDPKAIGIVFTMIQEYGNKPIAAQRAFMNQLKRNKTTPVFKHYIKRNDTLFADAPVYGIPVVLNGFNNNSHQSVVDGLEEVTDDFSTAIGL